jgi:hypothetical protein
MLYDGLSSAFDYGGAPFATDPIQAVFRMLDCLYVRQALPIHLKVNLPQIFLLYLTQLLRPQRLIATVRALGPHSPGHSQARSAEKLLTLHALQRLYHQPQTNRTFLVKIYYLGSAFFIDHLPHILDDGLGFPSLAD